MRILPIGKRSIALIPPADLKRDPSIRALLQMIARVGIPLSRAEAAMKSADQKCVKLNIENHVSVNRANSLTTLNPSTLVPRRPTIPQKSMRRYGVALAKTDLEERRQA